MHSDVTRLLIAFACAALVGSVPVSCSRGPRTLEQSIADLDYPDPADRERAARELADMGPLAAPAVPALIKSLGEESEDDVRLLLARALGNIGDIAAVPALTQALDDNCPGVRSEAAVALGKLGGTAALPELIEHLDDEDSHVRVHAAGSAAKLGETKRALGVLVGGLDDLSYEVRFCAAYALAEIGPEAAVAVPALVDRLDDSEARVRREVACALGEMGEAAAPAVPELIGCLSDESFLVRAEAAWALGQIGEAAAPAVPALTKLTQGEVDHVGDAAKAALVRISGAKSTGTQ